MIIIWRNNLFLSTIAQGGFDIRDDIHSYYLGLMGKGKKG